MELMVTIGLKAHSAILDLARTIAPASFSRRTIVASVAGAKPFSASEPAVVCSPAVL